MLVFLHVSVKMYLSAIDSKIKNLIIIIKVLQ